MSSFEAFRRVSRQALIGAAIAACLPASAAIAAEQQQDDDEWIDTKIMRGFMEGLGLKRDGAGIDYRERSPLVVPPARNLPAPETVSASANNPAWPVDPDEKLRKESRKKTSGAVDEDRPMTPSQLGRKGARGTGQQQQSGTSTGGLDDRPMLPSEYNPGGKSIWNLFGSSKKDEVVQFTGEPTRNSLVAPPPGYQTPSPNAPYGIVTPTQGQKQNVTDAPTR